MKLTHIYSIILFLAPTCLWAQNARNGNDTLETGEVIIVKEFEPTIASARKMGSQPKLIELKTRELSFQYEEKPVSFESGFQPDSIKAARLKGEPLSRLYRNYLKLGLGNYLTTFGELYVNNVRSRNSLWGVGLKHRASSSGIDDYPFSGYSNNRAEVYGTKFLRSHQINGQVSYDRQKVHYYGLNDYYFDEFDYEDIEKDDIAQTYNELQAKAGIESFYADSSDLNYKINGKYTYLGTPEYTFLTNSQQVQENNILLQTSFNRYFGEELAVLNFDLDYNQQLVDTNGTEARVNDPNLFAKINPQIEFKGSKWRLSIGLNVFIESEEEMNYRFYPNAFFKYNVYDDYVIPYVGIKGGLTRTNYNSLRQENPYLSSNLTLENLNTRYNVFGGVRGAFSSQISFNVQASIRQEANSALFEKVDYTFLSPILSSSNYQREYSSFGVVYDTIDITQVTAELTFFEENRFNLLARMDYMSYNMKNETKPWHLPQIKATVTGRYDLRDKIVASASFFYVGERYAKTYDPSEGEEVASDIINGVTTYTYGVKLPGYFDANLGVEYRYNKKLSGFLNLNNILSQNYEIWHDYKSQGINVMLGVTYSFWSRN